MFLFLNVFLLLNIMYMPLKLLVILAFYMLVLILLYPLKLIF